MDEDKKEDKTKAILICLGVATVVLLFVLPVNWWVVIGSLVVCSLVTTLIAAQISNGNVMIVVFTVLAVASVIVSLFLGYAAHVGSSGYVDKNYADKEKPAICSMPSAVAEMKKQGHHVKC